MKRLQSFVAEKWESGGGKTAILVNPANEEVLGEATTGGIDMAAAVAHARNVGGPALARLSFGERAALLQDLAKVLHAEREALLDLSQENGGNTRGDAKFDVDGAIGTLGAYATFGSELAKRTGERRFLLDGAMIQPTRSTRFVGQHVYLPRPGVAVHINAFNFPAWGTFEKVAVAFLAGIPVITKPATATALLTWRMVELLVESGKLPEGSLQLLCGSVGDLLEHLGAQDHLAFTGGSTTAALLKGNANLVRRAVRVNIEADSLNAAVLGPDVTPGSDLWNVTLRNVVTDLTQKTGQKCTAIRRVLVPEAVFGEFGEELSGRLTGVTVGDPRKGAGMGPVSTASQLRDVLGGIRTVAEGGTLLLGSGERVDGFEAPTGKGYFVQPTVILAQGDAVHDVEVFGPVTSLVAYDGSATGAAALLARGQGSLVSSAASDDREWLGTLATRAGPWMGRLLLLSEKVADQATAPGMVLPSLLHGGPGRAGGGEELGGERGLFFYFQRTAVTGDRVVVGKLFGEG